MGFLSRDPVPNRFDDLRQRLPQVRFRPSALLALVPVVVLGFFVLRGCDSADIPELRAPDGAATPTTSAIASTTVPPALVDLAPVAGTTTTTEPIATGTARLVGSVVGPTGPLGGAVVRVEHIVGAQISTVDVASAPDGRWELVDIPGGRYRVRAFQAPLFAQAEPMLFFMPDGEERRLDLTTDDFAELGVAVAVAPIPPIPNQPLNLVVQVTRRTVGSDGTIRAEPVAGQIVELLGTGTWARLTPSPTATSDGRGEVSYLATCRSPGPNQVNLAIKAMPFAPSQFATVAVPDCVLPAPPTQPPTSVAPSTVPPAVTSPSTTQG